MGSSTANTLVPARFLTTVGHLLASIMLYVTRGGNIRASLPLNDSFNFGAYNASVTAALALTWVCFAIEFAGLFLGLSMFLSKANSLYVCAHFTAIILCCIFMTQAWPSNSYWYIFGFCR